MTDAKALLDAQTSDFAKTLLVMAQRDIKAKFGAAHLLVNLEVFMKLQPLVADLESIAKRLQRMHKAMSATS